MQLTGNKLYITRARDAWHLLTLALGLWYIEHHTKKNVDTIE